MSVLPRHSSRIRLRWLSLPAIKISYNLKISTKRTYYVYNAWVTSVADHWCNRCMASGPTRPRSPSSHGSPKKDDYEQFQYLLNILFEVQIMGRKYFSNFNSYIQLNKNHALFNLYSTARSLWKYERNCQNWSCFAPCSALSIR